MNIPKDAQYFYAGLYYKTSSRSPTLLFYWDDWEWRRSSLTVSELRRNHPRHISVAFSSDRTKYMGKRNMIIEALRTDLYSGWTDTKLANLLNVGTSTVRLARKSLAKSEGSYAGV